MLPSSKVIFTVLLLFAAPIIGVSFPSLKNVSIILIEFFAEIAILCYALRRIILFRKTAANLKALYPEILFLIGIVFLFFADCLYGLRLHWKGNVGQFYNVCSELLYGGFALFITLSFCLGLFPARRYFKNCAWIGLLILAVNFYLNQTFILSEYFKLDIPQVMKINALFYALCECVIFSCAVPVVLCLIDRKVYFYFQTVILLLISDFSLRHQVSFISPSQFSWAEYGWCTALSCLAWLSYSNQEESFLFKEETTLVPFKSVRGLLTLAICGANALLLVTVMILKSDYLKSADDVSSCLFLLFAFWIVANEVSLIFAEELAKIIPGLFSKTEDSSVKFHITRVKAKISIYEISNILNSYNSLVDQTNKMIDLTEKATQDRAIAKIASQVFHDIRSPLAALSFIVSRLDKLPEATRIIIRDATQRINDIANELLCSSNALSTNQSKNSGPKNKSIQLISSIVDSLVSEKRIEFKDRLEIEIRSNFSSAYGLFANLNAVELKRTLSNLINNSAQALPNSRGVISLTVYRKDKSAIVEVTDNGQGIPENILSKVGEEGFSYRKNSDHKGNGLGLAHAKKTLRDLGGDLHIKSQFGDGTTVTLVLPLSNAPVWFVDKLSVTPGATIVTLDDDLCIHSVWRERFSSLDCDFTFLNFSSSTLFQEWVNCHSHLRANITYLIDYELLGQKENGLDLIEQCSISSQAILVTSRYEDVEILSRCEMLGIRLIPKGMSGHVPIELKKIGTLLDAVLIDDDILVRIIWEEAAREKNKALKAYSHLEDFMREAALIPVTTPVFLDSDLGHGIRAEHSISRIRALGFSRIHMVTGFPTHHFSNIEGIDSVLGKAPAF